MGNILVTLVKQTSQQAENKNSESIWGLVSLLINLSITSSINHLVYET